MNIKADSPFQLVQVDTMNLPHSTRGYKYVLNVVDQHSKWFASQPLKNKAALSCAQAFGKILAGLPKIPQTVMSDNGTEFSGESFSKLLHDLTLNKSL